RTLCPRFSYASERLSEKVSGTLHLVQKVGSFHNIQGSRHLFGQLLRAAESEDRLDFTPILFEVASQLRILDNPLDASDPKKSTRKLKSTVTHEGLDHRGLLFRAREHQ
ncbi:MAG TPA: hypothetical protein VKI65_07390, partial [Gemmataceae bacterium]|nr:hypothetical protein [Gemmataceae bacterium]